MSDATDIDTYLYLEMSDLRDRAQGLAAAAAMMQADAERLAALASAALDLAREASAEDYPTLRQVQQVKGQLGNADDHLAGVIRSLVLAGMR